MAKVGFSAAMVTAQCHKFVPSGRLERCALQTVRRLLSNQQIAVKIKKGRRGGISCDVNSAACALQVDVAPVSRTEVSKSGTEVGIAIPVPARRISDKNKGWTDATGYQDQRVVNQLRALAVVASDRRELHAILATQRDNWNRLFHSTIAIASVSAAAAAALNGSDEQAPGLTVVATILSAGVAVLMVLMNNLQPSQLAEEQRNASRLFRHLTKDIEATLETDPSLREEASVYWEESVETLHALDAAYPMPLTPVVLEKFPKVVRPSTLSSPVRDIDSKKLKLSPTKTPINGWSSSMEVDLERTAQLLHSSDVQNYVEHAKSANEINKRLATTSSAMAFGGMLCNMLCAVAPALQISGVGAAMTVGAFVAHSFSHAMQFGAVYETCRNCAGYYLEVEKSIQKALLLPVQQRENGTLFRQNVCLLLGRSPASSHLVEPGDKRAGTLF